MLIKKKDVNDYFAARRASRRPGGKQPSVVPPAKSPSVKGAKKGLRPAASINVPGTPASTQDLSVPFFTSEPGFIDSSPSAVKRRENS